MHEISLIYDLIEAVAKSAVENNISRVERVKLVVGECYGALPDALSFAFELLAQDTPCRGAALEIETVPALYRCRCCGREFGGGAWALYCPRCGAGGAALLKGRELYIDYYEGEEACPPQDGLAEAAQAGDGGVQA